MQPAQSLAEAAQFLEQRALESGSSLYQDLGPARATSELTKLGIFLRRAAAIPKAWAKAAFVGNRGGGKSTYLLHLEHDLEKEHLFTPVHIYLDGNLEGDCDYSDLFLWIVHEVAAAFARRGHPVDDAELTKVAEWFAERSFERTTDWKKEIGLETHASAKAGSGLPGLFSFQILARLKSMIVGSETSRKTIRQHIQNYAGDLIGVVNSFLDHARAILARAGKPSRLLIVQDNLDRLRGDAPRRLFEQGGHLLTSLDADIIYTAPLAMNLAPFNLSALLHTFTLPNAKVRLRDGKTHPAGIRGLLDLVGRRLDLTLVFDGPAPAQLLVEKCGGSVRDLIRLLDEAQLAAQVAGSTVVDLPAAEAAVRKLALSFSRALLPGSAYFPILAEIHRTKREFEISDGDATVARVAAARAFFAELIGSGAVLEYNGDDSWYDVHPAVCELQAFRDACKPKRKKKS